MRANWSASSRLDPERQQLLAAKAIDISARITDSNLEFTVEDEGPGIPTMDCEHIFDPFFRVQTTNQARVRGHGLGLAICRSIVLTHGGRIEATNRQGGGARFSVFLPIRGPGGYIESTDQPAGRDGSSHRGASVV
jgi:signal transduction histidine kinase